ncbi:MAG: sodium:proton antiporter [Hyphomicrobiales bacterium]|nr:sodium:proton antiporter [Hyphomicrobiales bacterium]
MNLGELRPAKAVAAIACVLLLAGGSATPALAAGLDGARMSPLLALPFAGVLLSIALFPLLAPNFWHHHFGKVAAFWSLLALVPMAGLYGVGAAAEALFHAAALEYAPFILLLLALFTAAGGIVVRGNLHDSPLANTGLLAVGTACSSVIGTTGAAMVFVRPLLRANDDRRHNAHVVVFFIFLVANVGGALTPLGDPPLFLGFLRGVDFFWTTQFLWKETLLTALILLGVFFALDTYMQRHESDRVRDPTPDSPLRVTGLVNFALIGVVIAAILMSATWKPGIGVTLLGTRIELQNVLRELTMIAVAIASMRLTNDEDRKANGFEWGPIVEVAKLFAGIFACIIPVLAMLQAGREGPFAALVALVANPDGSPRNAAYFWLTGALSSFLDNAPTYLVFFELAGGDPAKLMGPLAQTLAAISLGAVYMGANTYIGNAPNFMVYAIARSAGVNMPSFFGYMLWSGAVLIPTFLLLTFLFF